MEAAARKKLVILQIDGLSYDDLRYCIEHGYAPFIKSLLLQTNSTGYFLYKYYPGLPTTTPAVQSAIMYGKNTIVAGFRFVDKQRQRKISFANPFDAAYIENKYFKQRKGLLQHSGSSYFNHFSGNAGRSLFTLSTLWKQSKLQKLKQSDLWLIFFRNPFRIAKVAYLAAYEIVIEYLEALWESTSAFFSGRKAKIPFIFSLVRMNMNVISRELGTVAVITDMKRAVPVIYLNYLGYDEVSHHRGPSNRSAYRVVRAIDRNIKRIFRNRDSHNRSFCNRKDDYDIYLLSDHGQTAAVPFKRVYRQSLAGFVQQLAAVTVDSVVAGEEELDDTDLPLQQLGQDVKNIAQRNLLARFLFSHHSLHSFMTRKRKNVAPIIIQHSSCFAQLYFMEYKQHLTRKEIDIVYPAFMQKLIHHPGIGAVLGKETKGFFLLTKQGMIQITEKATLRRENDRQLLAQFLLYYNESISSEVFLKHVVGLLQKSFIGDLVVVGAMYNEKIISFADHFGAHGAFGGKQTAAFFMSTQKMDKQIIEASQLYDFFQQNYSTQT